MTRYLAMTDIKLMGLGRNNIPFPLQSLSPFHLFKQKENRVRWIKGKLRDLWHIGHGDAVLAEKYKVSIFPDLIKVTFTHYNYFYVSLYIYCKVPQSALDRVFAMPESGISIEPADFLNRMYSSSGGQLRSYNSKVFPFYDFLVLCNFSKYVTGDSAFSFLCIPENTEMGRFLSSEYVLFTPGVEHIIGRNFLNIKVYAER